MGVLQRFERRLGGLVEGAFARVFKGAVEPVEVVSALQREAGDRRRVLGEGRVLVPNRYVVELGPTDYATLDSYGPQLREEMAGSLRSSLADNGWTTFGPIAVDLARIDSLDTGVFRVHGEVTETEPPRRRSQPGSPPAPVERTQMMPAATSTTPPGRSEAPSRARLIDEHGRLFPLGDGVVVIGRGADADCALPDTGVSRRHAELRIEGRRILVRDLGSTNGTQVNGRTVGERELQHGDRVQVGSTVLTLRTDG